MSRFVIIMVIPDYCIASYCTSRAWGGLELNVLRFLGWMQQRGWQVCLYAVAETRLFKEAIGRGIPVRAVRQRFDAGDVVNAWRLARRMKRDNVKRLIVNQTRDMFVAVTAKRFGGPDVRTIYFQHMHVGGTKKDVYHAWLHRSLDAWVTPVQWLADRVREKTKLQPERLHIIPHGQELSRFTDRLPDRLEARRRYGVSGGVLLVGMVGRLDPKKGQDVAIEALARVRNAGHDAHLLIVGDVTVGEGDEYARKVRQLIKDLGLSDVVHLYPHDEEVEWAYAGLDVFVLASKSECYGMVTLEAMASGIPVIGTNDGGTVSMIDHECTGLLVTPKSVDELAKAIIRLIESPEQAKSMAAIAREEAKVKYSHTFECEQWEKLLTSW